LPFGDFSSTLCIENKKGEEKTSSDYFLAENTLPWWAIGTSLIASNISAFFCLAYFGKKQRQMPQFG
jgi:Na+/proline symporter